MIYEAVIFDLDGVICHTDQYHYKAWKKISDELNIVFNETINNRLRGVSRMESFEIILELYKGTLTKEQKNQFTSRKNDYYVELLSEMSHSDLDKKIKATLQTLKDNGIKVAIGSSSKNARFILNRIGLENFFDAISDGNNIINSKPDPEVFLKAAYMLDINPTRCLVVEDAKVGIEASINAQMDSAAIGDAVKCKLATYNIEDLTQLLIICQV